MHVVASGLARILVVLGEGAPETDVMLVLFIGELVTVDIILT